MEMYCVKCRTKKHLQIWEVEFMEMKNGKPAAKARCKDCGTGMFKIGNFTPDQVMSPQQRDQQLLRNVLESKI